MNRKERRAARRTGARIAPGLSGIGTSADPGADLFTAAVNYHQAGALVEAERAYRQYLSMFSADANAHSRLGAVIMAQGRTNEAIPHMARAVALNPTLFEGYGNLAQAYTLAGRREDAIDAACRVLELRETPQTRAMFAQCVSFARFTADNERFRALLLRALTEGWVRPRELTSACISLIKHNPTVQQAIAVVDAAWPKHPSAQEMLGAQGMITLAGDRLLCSLLERDPVTDVALERLLTSLRHAMLATAAAEGAVEEAALKVYCAVARQCFVNEYVFSTSESEAHEAQQLRALLESALANGEACPPLWPVAVGAFFPLHLLTNAGLLLARAWPQEVESLLVQQIREPAEERDIAASIRKLSEIDDDVSRAVRQQYEENPYPRWTATAMPAQSGTHPSPRLPQVRDALVAGCGTGLSTIAFAQQSPAARILAIDLSLASLGYAARMARKLGLANIEFAQADMMKLDSLGRQFDFIDTSGVLHHLADPWAGWRILLRLLRPGGLMQVGLYSELARANVVAARALIAERGYRPTPQDIRRCREDLMASDDPLLKSLSATGDFFTIGECRDLMFHVQEHRTSLPDIKAFLVANDLGFVGFHLDALVLHAFARRFPAPAAAADLDCWHAFETEAPNTFAGMYQFAVRKRAAGSA